MQCGCGESLSGAVVHCSPTRVKMIVAREASAGTSASSLLMCAVSSIDTLPFIITQWILWQWNSLLNLPRERELAEAALKAV